MHPLDELLNQIGNKKLLAIFAHPDDETMLAGGLLLHAKQLGFETNVFILTQGAAGQIHTHPRGKTLKQVRREELEKAAKILKIDNLIIDDFDDGKLREQVDKWVERVVQVVTAYKPGIVVTFDPSGWTGHPDHIVTCVEINKVLKTKFPKIVLVWRCLPKLVKDNWIHKGCVGYMVEPQYVLDIRQSWIKKWLAARAYKSQRFGQKLTKPLFKIIASHKHEWYHVVDYSKTYKHKFVKFDI